MSRERLPKNVLLRSAGFEPAMLSKSRVMLPHAAPNTGQHSGRVWSIRQDADAEKILD